ncbi:MAG: hypothetical protein V2I33_00455, partial [Kangiellaceae bacterium]|nr:hypothetical protein [Kangiellaceae bacterium]
MKQLATLVASATLAAMISHTASADQTSHVYGLHDRSPNQYALTNATVITEPGKSLSNATIVINDGRIVSVKSKGKAPAGVKVIDLTGHTVYPGFIDAYSNYVFGSAKRSGGGRNMRPQYDGTRVGGNAWNDAIHAEVNWVSEFKADNKAAKAMIKNGFTAVQTAKFDGILQGQAVTVSLGDGVPNDLIYNANASHFGSFNKGSSKQQYPSSL